MRPSQSIVEKAEARTQGRKEGRSKARHDACTPSHAHGVCRAFSKRGGKIKSHGRGKRHGTWSRRGGQRTKETSRDSITESEER
jgi:hypothetical protein